MTFQSLPPLSAHEDECQPPARRGPTIIRPAPDRRSAFYSAAALEGRPVPPRQWLVHGLVPQKTVTLFSGDGGTGKSLLALQLAVAVAAQTAWIGRTANTGRAIFLSAEDDDDELHRRLDDILRAEGRGYNDLSGLTMRSLAGEDALLATDGNTALVQSALFEELDKRAAEEAPALIVLDTLADMYPANENDRAKVRQFVGILRGLALRQKCAVLLLSHPSLSGLNSGSGTSGSTAWHNSVRSRLYLSRITDNGFEPDPDARVLSTRKANYARTGGEINLKWQSGVFVAESQPTGLDARAAGAKGERVFLKLLDALTAQGRYVSASPGPTFAPSIFASHPDAEGCTKRALKSAMEALFGRGAIAIASHGKGAKARSHIVKSEGATPGATLNPTPGTTPRQPPANEGATHTPIPPCVAPAADGWVHAADDTTDPEAWA
ncbi:MAG: AAA family ATPase [Roseovarius sp.]|jgi:RecA-family ATPase|nr:AAA family ATPase [Roseovarius sp.]